MVDLLALAGSMTGPKVNPVEQAVVTGKPATEVFAERVQLVAFVTVAERVTEPPMLNSFFNELAKCEIFGFGVEVAPAGSARTIDPIMTPPAIVANILRSPIVPPSPRLTNSRRRPPAFQVHLADSTGK
jgi:hypothetical protein